MPRNRYINNWYINRLIYKQLAQKQIDMPRNRLIYITIGKAIIMIFLQDSCTTLQLDLRISSTKSSFTWIKASQFKEPPVEEWEITYIEKCIFWEFYLKQNSVAQVKWSCKQVLQMNGRKTIFLNSRSSLQKRSKRYHFINITWQKE